LSQRERYDWVVLQDTLRSQVVQTGAIAIATLNITAAFPVRYTISDLFDAGNNSYIADQVGLRFTDNTIMASTDARILLQQATFPLTGVINIANTHCMSRAPSPSCSISIPFSLQVLMMFNPGCPVNLIRFSHTTSTVVSWNEVQIQTLSGLPVPLISTFRSGDEFPLGFHQVVYTLGGNDSSQHPSTVVRCEFSVSLHMAMVLTKSAAGAVPLACLYYS
jgi:hypothetical protein